MTNLVALNPEKHKHLKINKDKLEAQGANERIVPVVIGEFSKLVVQYPIALTKSEETGEFICVAVLGFEQKENLFWNNNRWDGIYTPLNIIRQPFFIGNDQGQSVVCIDEHGSSVSEQQGEAIFNKNGGESQFLLNIKTMLAGLLEQERVTKEFIKTLVEYDLLIAMPLDITFGNGEAHRVRGFYTVDESKLETLEPSKLVDLQKNKYLTPLHMIMASTGHFYSLVEMKNRTLTPSGTQKEP